MGIWSDIYLVCRIALVCSWKTAPEQSGPKQKRSLSFLIASSGMLKYLCMSDNKKTKQSSVSLSASHHEHPANCKTSETPHPRETLRTEAVLSSFGKSGCRDLNPDLWSRLSPQHHRLHPRIKRIIQRQLHKRRHTRLLRPSAARYVEHLDAILADEGCQSLTGTLVAAALA